MSPARKRILSRAAGNRPAREKGYRVGEEEEEDGVLQAGQERRSVAAQEGEDPLVAAMPLAFEVVESVHEVAQSLHLLAGDSIPFEVINAKACHTEDRSKKAPRRRGHKAKAGA